MHIVKEKFPEQRGTDAGWKTFPTGKADRFLSRHRHGADSIGKLISIPPQIETLLWNFAKQHPAERVLVEKTIRFRECVGEEFERLLTPLPS